MAQLLLQGGMWGRQELAEDTWAEMHMGLDAGVSEGVQAAVEGSQVAVRRMPAETCANLASEWGVWVMEEALLLKTGAKLMHEAMQFSASLSDRAMPMVVHTCEHVRCVHKVGNSTERCTLHYASNMTACSNSMGVLPTLYSAITAWLYCLHCIWQSLLQPS